MLFFILQFIWCIYTFIFCYLLFRLCLKISFLLNFYRWKHLPVMFYKYAASLLLYFITVYNRSMLYESFILLCLFHFFSFIWCLMIKINLWFMRLFILTCSSSAIIHQIWTYVFYFRLYCLYMIWKNSIIFWYIIWKNFLFILHTILY